MSSWRWPWRGTPNGLPASGRSSCAIATPSPCSIRRDSRAIWNPHTRQCGGANMLVCRLQVSRSQADLAALFADHKAFQNKALDEDDFFIVVQLARDVANGIDRGVQREIQRGVEE